MELPHEKSTEDNAGVTQALCPDRSRDQHSILLLVDARILLQGVQNNQGSWRSRVLTRPNLHYSALLCPTLLRRCSSTTRSLFLDTSCERPTQAALFCPSLAAWECRFRGAPA